MSVSMNAPGPGNPAITGTILVVDDNEANVRLLSDLLTMHGFAVRQAGDGASCLASIAEQTPDLVLLDVVMPRMDGFTVCRKLREDPENRMLPVVMVTALDPQQERVKGLEAGADDFLSKPINAPELIARVRSLLRVKLLYDQVESLARELAALNATLEARVADELARNARLTRLKRFVSPRLADLILAGGAQDPLVSHRREIAVVYIDLRGFTAFAENTEPELVMRALHDYHEAMGRVILRFDGTLERFTGDGMVVFFNDPLPIPDPAGRAVGMAVALRHEAGLLAAKWTKHGFELGTGLGVAFGFATLGAIGFEERIDYGAIGTVTNLAARLCSEAPAGEIYVSQRVHAAVEAKFGFEALGPLAIRGLSRPQLAYRLLDARGPDANAAAG